MPLVIAVMLLVVVVVFTRVDESLGRTLAISWGSAGNQDRLFDVTELVG